MTMQTFETKLNSNNYRMKKEIKQSNQVLPKGWEHSSHLVDINLLNIDLPHFKNARVDLQEPVDLACIPHPRLGFMGIIDESMDLHLLEWLAIYHPDWQIVLIGALRGIEVNDLPKQPNIHFLGLKSYDDIPAYLAGLDVAIMPYTLNKMNRYDVWPRVLQYMAAGKMIISTPLPDIVHPFGDLGLVWTAGTEAKFFSAIKSALTMNGHKKEWQSRVDEFLNEVVEMKRGV